VSERELRLECALAKIVQMNLQTAHDKYGNHAKAYSWSCVKVAEEALGRRIEWQDGARKEEQDRSE
jgi:hypothetical protein